MYGTNLETSRVVLSTVVMSMLAAVLAAEIGEVEERDFGFFDPPKRAPLCGVNTHASRSHCLSCTQRAVKAKQITRSGSIVSRELNEQETKIENWTLFQSTLPQQRMQLRSSTPMGKRHLGGATCIHVALARCCSLCMRG